MKDKELMQKALGEAYREWKEGGARMAREFEESLKEHENLYRNKVERYIAAAVNEGAYVSDIAKWLGVSRGTVYRLLQVKHENKEAVND